MNTVIHYRPDRHLRTACGQARWTLNSFGETVPLHSFSHPPSRYPVPRSFNHLGQLLMIVRARLGDRQWSDED